MLIALARLNSRPDETMEYTKTLDTQISQFTNLLDDDAFDSDPMNMDLDFDLAHLYNDNSLTTDHNIANEGISQGWSAPEISFDDFTLYPETWSEAEWGAELGDMAQDVQMEQNLTELQQDWFSDLLTPSDSSNSHSVTPTASLESSPPAPRDLQMWMPDWKQLEETCELPGPIMMVSTSIPAIAAVFQQPSDGDSILLSQPMQPMLVPQAPQTRTASRALHSCSSCDQKFGSRKDMRRHVESIHRRGRSHRCPHPDCQYHQEGFSRKDILKRHLERKH